MNTANQLYQQAIHLPEDQRLALAHKLLSAVEPEDSIEVANIWDKEIRNRISRYDKGEILSCPAGEVFKKLDTQLKA